MEGCMLWVILLLTLTYSQLQLDLIALFLVVFSVHVKRQFEMTSPSDNQAHVVIFIGVMLATVFRQMQVGSQSLEFHNGGWCA